MKGWEERREETCDDRASGLIMKNSQNKFEERRTCAHCLRISGGFERRRGEKPSVT